MKRRAFVHDAVVAGSVAAFPFKDSEAEAETSPVEILDSNVSLSRWPFRRLPLDRTEILVAKLTGLGIGRAFAGSFEGILHRDIRAVNQRLATACAPHDQLVPIGSINPELPGWENDLRRCREDLNMPGIRLHPNYHGYSLNDEKFLKLLRLAAELNLFVQIATTLEDTRTQPEKLQVADLDLGPLPEKLKDHPGIRVQLLNWRPRGALLESLAAISSVFIDSARVEATDGIARLLKAFPADRVLFGSHAPFLIPEAALIRVYESNLPPANLRSVLHENANRFWI